MSKKQFVALADSIREHNRLAKFNGENAFTVDQLAALARFCASENPRFKRERPALRENRRLARAEEHEVAESSASFAQRLVLSPQSGVNQTEHAKRRLARIESIVSCNGRVSAFQ
jgi:hypothetical protein